VSTIDEILDRSNLTGRQLLIYAGQRLHPDMALYNSIYANRWPDLERARFDRAWQQLVDSSDALRTVFHEVHGIPQQEVLVPFTAEVEYIDFSRDADPEASVKAWIDARLLRPLVLSERIFDTALLRTGEHEFVWFLHIHHIVVDGAGVQILLRRVTELYAGLPADDPVPQFAEYAAKSCAQRQSEEYPVAKGYWQALLNDAPEIPNFYGVDGSRTTQQRRVVIKLDASTSSAISSLARSLATPAMSEHAVLANLFNAVFAAYLSRVGGNERVSVGATFHNRSSERDRRTIGLFMEVFPLVLHVQPQDSLISLMQKVVVSTKEALRHRQYSVGHSTRSPAFSGLYNYMRSLAKPVGGLQVRRFHPGYGSNAISLSVDAHPDSYDLWFDLNADVAATSSAQQLAAHLQHFLRAAVNSPEQALATHPLLAPDETKKLLAVCRGPTLEQAQQTGGCHAQFEAMASIRPQAIALSCSGSEVSYGELNLRANRLARQLRAYGAKPGNRVAICVERSPEMVIAVLAVMKSGAAYVPLDPSYPQARMHMMLVDADPVVLMTTERISTTLPPHAARPLYIDQETASAGGSDNLAIQIGASDVAYIIYTSGSTGTPKGVLVTHGNVSNHLAWRRSYFPVRPIDRCLQSASLSFDDSVWEIFEPLTAGACLVLTRPQFEYDSAYLVKLIIAERVSVACFVPSLLRAVIEEPHIGACGTLRRISTGGEGLSVALERRVLEQLPAAEFFNGYGTTETTIGSLYWKCCAIPGQSTVPIGRPIANTQVYILDSLGQLVPPGVLGEICIGGAGVAQGYLKRTELTAQRFIPDRHGGDCGATLYRTGDLGRLRDDVFEFCGRVDDQVKIRGVRVELGDIEAAISAHPGVRAAAVVRSETASDTRLTAYFVPREEVTVSAAQLRSFVRDRIPSALVPNHFVSIGALPTTPSGKLDRRSLPAGPTMDDSDNYVAPRCELESHLVSMWEEVLQARPIGIYDDFFSLGGHSLSAVRVAAAIEGLLGRPVSPGVLFEAPTIDMLSRSLSAPSAANGRGALVPLTQGGPRQPLFLVHHVSGDITAYKDLAPYLGSDRPIYGLRAPELDSGEEPLDRIEAMASRYVREICAEQPRGPYLLAGHSAGAHIAFEIAQQLRSAGKQVSILAIL
jgi:amino acid adenylation domain-containing protein